MVLVFSSVTYAIKAQKLLANGGISSDLIRTPRIREIKGCGYGLRLSEKDYKQAAKLLGEENIKILTVIKNER